MMTQWGSVLDTVVCLPNYNYGEFLERAIQSALDMNPMPGEISIVDDGSTDNSVDIIKRYHKRYPNIIKYGVLERNSGGGETPLNEAIRISKGKFIAPMGSDDTIFPDYFAKVLPQFTRPTIGVVRTGMNEIYRVEEKVVYPRAWVSNDRVKDLLEANRVYGCACYRREMWEDLGGYDEKGMLGDWDFWIRAAIRGWEFADSYSPGINYKKHGSSLAASPRIYPAMVYLARKYESLIREKQVTEGPLVEILNKQGSQQ
jgi:GT2 family glycosyltransferase